MIKLNQVWKCEICGNIVEVVHGGPGALVCCGEAMKQMNENTVDAAVEKHKPVIEGGRVSVGSVFHPMEEAHYIEWIEATDKDGVVSRKYLEAGDEPIVEFCFEVVSARAYCNLHGLWA